MARFVKRARTLLDVSRLTAGKLHLQQQEVDVCEVAAAVVSAFEPEARYAGASIALHVPSTALRVFGDRLAIEEVFDNLISNAIKYGGGTAIRVSAAADVANGVAHISVADGGSGISIENQARIFERFERAVPSAEHAGGFGVGLWIVRQLAEAMKGSIAVSSEPGVGSTFRITLPLTLRSSNDHDRP